MLARFKYDILSEGTVSSGDRVNKGLMKKMLSNFLYKKQNSG